MSLLNVLYCTVKYNIIFSFLQCTVLYCTMESFFPLLT